MKTYILASIFTDKEGLKIFKNNDGNQGINWFPGAPIIRYREHDTDKEFLSSADTRRDNFAETIWNLLYKNNHRYYTENLGNRFIADKYAVTRVQVLLAEKNICSSDEIPGLAVLEVEVPKEETGQEFKIDVEKVYQYIAENQLIPGFKIDDEEAKRNRDGSESDKLQKSMWKKNIKPFMYVVNIVNSLNFDDAEILENFKGLKKDENDSGLKKDKNDSDRLKFIEELHKIADRREPSAAAKKKWTKEDPKWLKIEGDSEYIWFFYTRSNGMVYYFPDSKIKGSDLPICFQGYAESFHLDAIMLSVLKNILVNYYTGQIQKFVFIEDKKEIKNINNAINRMYIMYDMGRTNPRGGKHVIAMEKVEAALYFEQNLNVLKDSVEKIEGINSAQRQEDLSISQEKLARDALLIAMVMIIPGFVSVVNDGISSIVNYPWTLIIYLFVVVIIFCYIWRNPDEIKNIKTKIRSVKKIDREDHNK